MVSTNHRANLRFALGFIALFFAAVAQASLLDCRAVSASDLPLASECQPLATALAPGLVNSDPGTETIEVAASHGFQLNPPRAVGSLPDSVLLIAFFTTLIAVFMVKAKSINTK